ncbi:helicase POLQ-like [Planococcus citri]|uniref:helicase POLQ-like n=1 Tax=Planococcus citri TaxID=170843 RepID=UPI0031F7875C
MADFFNDTWDISMSVIPDFNNDSKTGNSFLQKQSSHCSAARGDNSFFGLSDNVRALILKYKGIEKLYEWQEKCLNLPAVKKRQNLVYSLPTSGGKTLVAEILMLKELILHKNNVIFVLPFVALAQEKVHSLSPFALDLEFYVEEYIGGKGVYPPKKHRKRSVYVCTTEKAAGLIESLLETNRLDEVGMLVIDEVHLIGDASRGPVLEMMLSKLMYVSKNMHIIAMSATVGNLNEISRFLNAQLYNHDFRPVELIEYMKYENKVFRVERNSEKGCNIVQDRVLVENYTPEMKKIDPAFLGLLVHEVIPDDSCLVFCSTKKLCSSFAILICRISMRPLREIKVQEKKALLETMQEENQGNVDEILKKTIPYGVAFHHSGLTNAERKLLEEAFISGTISCICCTSTLAAGVNLPAKRVIISSPYVGMDFLKLSTYKQMSGRAGRTGLTSAGESFLLCEERDMSKVLELLNSSMNCCNSQLTRKNFVNLTMGAIGLKIATTLCDLEKLYSCTLNVIQNESNDIKQTVIQSVNDLDDSEAIIKKENDKFCLTSMAKAAQAANLDINEAKQIYKDLFEAVDSGLLLSNNLHLFYLITPYTAIEDVRLARDVYISV